MQNIIISGKVKQLKELLYSQTCDNAKNALDNHTRLQLSQAYAELKHRNILLSDEIVNFIEYEFVKGSYLNGILNHYQDNGSDSSTKRAGLEDRVAHLVECVEHVLHNYRPGSFMDIDEMLILRLRQIYSHVFFLKTHLRKLPLLQLQFCIAVFLKLVTEHSTNGFDIYTFAIDKDRLVRFLKVIKDELIFETKPVISLECYIHCIKHRVDSTGDKQNSRIPKSVRAYIGSDLHKMSSNVLDCLKSNEPFVTMPKAVQQTLKTHYDKTIDWHVRRRSKRIFKELNETYFIMKQHYSIGKVLTYIDGVTEGPCSDPPHKHPPIPSPTRIRAIKRTLQVIGEMIKSTRESPNITAKLNRILQLITSEALTERTKDLRQFFSHGYSLAKWELEEENREQLITVFQKIETNLREARRWFVYAQTQQNMLLYRRYLAYLKGFKSIEALRSYITFIGTEFKASLIATFVPEQLTEAKLLIQYMISTSKSDVALDSNARDDLEYIIKELKLRIDTITAENKSLGRTVDEFFFLETYIRQPSATLARVQEIVDWILFRTNLSSRHKLVKKTDLVYARELLTRLQIAETDEERRYLWGSIWERLAKEQFVGLDTLICRTEQRTDVALEATINIMQALHLPLDDDEYVQFVNRRLAKSYYPNVYVLDNKYRVLKEIVKDRRAHANVRDVLEKLKTLRKADEIELQRMFDSLVDNMEEILNRSDQHTGKLDSLTDQLALEYDLLEATEILCNLALFRDNMADLETIHPIVSGRNLRNYLAHDFLAYETLTTFSRAVVLNARFLVENRLKLYNTSVGKVGPLKDHSNNFGERNNFRNVMECQTRWTMEQVEFFDHIKHFRTPILENQLSAIMEQNVDVSVSLSRRTFLDQDVLSIALNGNPAAFIAQLVHYEENNSNLFYLLTKYSQSKKLIEEIRTLIETPHAFCFRLAIRYGLQDVLCSMFLGCTDEILKKIITTEISSVFNRHSTEFVRQLVNHFPQDWFLNLKDHLGNTILHWAVLHGDSELLVFILERYRILLKVKNIFGDLPLLIAVRYHEDAIVKILLDNGADPWIEEKVIHTITMRGRKVLLECLRETRGSTTATQFQTFNNQPLRTTIEDNNIELFIWLHTTFKYNLKHGELLYLAARLDRINFIKYILTVSRDDQGETIDIDSVSKDVYFTPLMIACAAGNYGAAQLLLQHGANGLFVNENNYSPWHCAVHSGKRNILSLLQSISELNVNLVTRDKRSALTIAIENNQTTTQIELLLSFGVLVGTEHVMNACKLGRIDVLQLFFDRHPGLISARDYLDRSTLMVAIASKEEAVTQYLLDRGADRADVNVLGMNCLHIAALNNLINICNVLLEANVCLETKDSFGRTPLVVALENEHIAIVEQLLRYGADVKCAYDYRFKLHGNASLLHKFTIEKRPRMVDFLVKRLQFPIDIVDDDGKTACMYE
ncbi:uncharacterized protein LOC128725620 [Anopheles nili]|uniref:uncharacterized protein LOC128725620 n=1 Tax=Anopheles nili TaxID=185578 RepID=UPI00237C4489|nr:uncharacterized protein LOC128725620 [Anopheles nili]